MGWTFESFGFISLQGKRFPLFYAVNVEDSGLSDAAVCNG